jgi:hypothetical protein
MDARSRKTWLNCPLNWRSECDKGQVVREEEFSIINDLQLPENRAWLGDKTRSRASVVFAKASCKSLLVASPDSGHLIILHKLKDIEVVPREASQVFPQNYKIK